MATLVLVVSTFVVFIYRYLFLRYLELIAGCGRARATDIVYKSAFAVTMLLVSVPAVTEFPFFWLMYAQMT